MSQDAIQVITFFPSLIWQLFTGFKIPGLNMTPAVFFFGILSFGLAFRFLMGVINISTTGFGRVIVIEDARDIHHNRCWSIDIVRYCDAVICGIIGKSKTTAANKQKTKKQ